MSENTSSQATCKTCHQPVSKNYCAHCGEKVNANRISFKNFVSDILADTVSIEAPVLYTLKMVIINPGQVALRYVNGNRRVFTKPFTFFLLIIGVNFILNKWIIDPEALIQLYSSSFMQGLKMMPKENQKEMSEIVNWAAQAQNYMKEMNFALIPFLSLFSWLFFKKSGHNLLENVVLFFYALGITIFFNIISTLLCLISLKVLLYTGPILNITTIIYTIWAQVQFHQQVNFKGVLKAFLAYITATIAISMLVGFGLSYLVMNGFSW